MGSGINKYRIEFTANQLLHNEATLEQVIVKAPLAQHDIVPANSDLAAANVTLMECFSRESRLRLALNAYKDNYDYIFIDCPPALNMLTVNAMTAADSILVPTQCEYFALEGITELLDTVKQLSTYLNPNLKIEGVLRTMYDPRNRLTHDVSAQLKKHFQSKLYQTVIPRNVRLAEAPSHGMPIFYYDKASLGSKAYLTLASEMTRINTMTNDEKRSVCL